MSIIAPLVDGSLSIARMEPWTFWASSASLGSTEEETRALACNEVPAERVLELEGLTRLAFNRLVTAEPAGRA